MSIKNKRKFPSKRIKKRTFKQNNQGLSREEKMIVEANVWEIIDEYNLIQKKESKLSKNLREAVELKVKFYIQKGIIKRSDLLKNDSKQN